MRSLIFLSSLALLAGDANAQLIGAPSGERVRITAPDVSKIPIVGLILERQTDSLVVKKKDNTRVAIAKASIWKVERSGGTRPCSGLVPGLLAGFGLGIVAIVSAPGTEGALASPLAALVGFLVGYRVAPLFNCEPWVEVPVPQG